MKAWPFCFINYVDIRLKSVLHSDYRLWQEYQEKIKLYCHLFLQQHSPVPVQAGFF
jgi:hypothetical protein